MRAHYRSCQWPKNILTIALWRWVLANAVVSGNEAEYQLGPEAEACANRRQRNLRTPQFRHCLAMAQFHPRVC
jgi:hypothetical protein